MNKQTDIVVVGGGSTGTSIVFHLAKLGVEDVLLLEKEYIASGTTGKSSAIIRQHYSNEFTAKMALESLRFFQNFQSRVGGPCDFRNTGFLVCVGPEMAEGMRVNVKLQQAVGINTRILSKDELLRLEPQMYLDDIGAAAYEPESGYADPSTTANSFATAAQRLGVKIKTKTEVTDLLVSGGRIRGLVTNNGEITCNKVVFATNIWTKRIAEKLGEKIPIEPTRHPMCLFLRPKTFGKEHSILIDFVNQVYFRPEVGDQTWVGSLENIPDIIDANKYNENVDFETTIKYSEKFTRRYPIMAAGDFVRGYAGPYDVTPDWHPILDKSSVVQGVYWAVGFSGHGFKLCPAVGRMMAELICNGWSENIDFFRLSRFEEGKPIEAKYAYSVIA